MASFTPTSVFTYDDPLRFVIDRYDARKKTEAGFSIRSWAREMELSSPSILSAIVKGQRPLRIQFMSFLTKGLRLDPEEALFFKTLILKKSARSDEERQFADQLLARLRPARDYSSVYTPIEAIFDHWSIMAILSASRLAGKRLTRAKLHEVYEGYVDHRTLDEGIVLLKQEGLLSEDDQGQLSPVYAQVSSRNETANRGARNYYAQVLDMAKLAIELPMSERELQSFSVAIEDEKLAAAKEILRDTRTRLLALQGDAGTRVFQAHLQMFPVSRSV